MGSSGVRLIRITGVETVCEWWSLADMLRSRGRSIVVIHGSGAIIGRGDSEANSVLGIGSVRDLSIGADGGRDNSRATVW